VGAPTERRVRFRRKTDQEAARLIAIRSIIEAARDEEDHDVLIESLVVLGASEQEIVAATLGTVHTSAEPGL
jgi:hypothetical protein